MPRCIPARLIASQPVSIERTPRQGERFRFLRFRALKGDPCRTSSTEPRREPTKSRPTRRESRPLALGPGHTLVVIALGITWVLDGLEVTLAGSVAGALKASPVLHFTNSEVGLASSFYLAGAVSGALVFGWLADRLGRRLLFFVTLWLYLLSAAATAFSWDFVSFCLFRFLTGAGIGGEYSAVNSTIQEMIPARFRGWTDLALGGTFWIGGALGAGTSIVLLNPANINPEIGWRLGFFIGAVLSLGILVLRSFLPESPRWLAIHGREEEAEKVVRGIEAGFRKHGAKLQDVSELKPMRVHPRTHTPLKEVFKTIFANLSHTGPGRSHTDGDAGIFL